MKQSNLTFREGFLGIQAEAARKTGAKQKTFDWDKAAQLIKENLQQHPNLIAEAGLQGDWDYTGGTIFYQGKPVVNGYTYLSSNWATPTLILTDENWEMEIDCFTVEQSRFNAGSKWDEKSLEILGINL